MVNKSDFTVIIGGKDREPRPIDDDVQDRIRRGESSVPEILDIVFSRQRYTQEDALLWGGSIVYYTSRRITEYEDQQFPQVSHVTNSGEYSTDFAPFLQIALQSAAEGNHGGIRTVLRGLSNHYFFEGLGLQYSGAEGYLNCYDRSEKISVLAAIIPEGTPFIFPQPQG